MINQHRGEVKIVVDDQPRTMRLSLGAIAALEDQLGAQSMVEMVELFEVGKFKTRDLLLLLWAGLNGGGWDVSIEQIERSQVSGGPIEATKAAAQLLAVTFGGLEA